ncbi:MAG: plastocyanin/azurin family copper-binding protein [Chloroflexota bacterium]
MTPRQIAIALACVAVIGACAPVPADSTGPAASSIPALVTIKGFSFTPDVLEVRAGTTIVWTNQDDILHTVTSGSARNVGLGTYEASPSGAFDGKLDGTGSSFRFTFPTPGSYAYYCDRHRHMVATVVVK